MSLIGATLAGIVALTGRPLPLAALVTLWLAAAPIAGAVLVLLSAIRPRLGDSAPGTWLHAAAHGPSSLVEACDCDPVRVAAEHVAALAAVAVVKYRRISAAVSLLVCGLVLLALAGLLAVIA
ncbi:hypothetical protein BAY59_29185 [Prauserella coralliicola]|nr:hypothetical protein BAY59_29185 [Prauserella coralliicola]